MSENQNQRYNIPDDPTKSSINKEKLYESSTTDSGFLSGENLLISGEIESDNLEEPYPDNTNHFEDNSMRLDTGISLTESISNLKITHDVGLNDLSSSSASAKCLQEPSETDVSGHSGRNVRTDISRREPSWSVYFEQDEDGDTYLHMAIVNGWRQVVLALIRLAPHPRFLDTPNDDAQTPLHLAVELQQDRIARWLRVAGAKPCPRDMHGDTPIHIAARKGDLLCLRAVIEDVQKYEQDALRLGLTSLTYESCDVDQWNYVGETSVHVAALHGHIDILRHLVRYGADINAREGLAGYTALHFAVQRRDEALVQFLLTECKSLNPELTTYGGRNALQLKPHAPEAIYDKLRRRGVSLPFSSDEEDDSDESDISDDEMYQGNDVFMPSFVNATA